MFIWKPPRLILPVADTDPSNGKNPGPNLFATTEFPGYDIPNLLLIYPTTADWVGTTSAAFLVILSSGWNSVTVTPLLNPIPSRFESAILAENVTVPVP